MFKKNISVVQQRQASGKDGKQLRRDVQLQFPDVTEDELKELLPSKAELAVLKLSNRAQAYSVDGSVLFVDPEGRGDLLVPTVYTLWRLPRILPAVLTYSEVSPKVLGGADLFLQGFIVPPEGLPRFAAGDLMAIRIPGNAFPFAVGTMETSSEAVAQSGLKGKGVKLLHHFPDQLWQLGGSTTPGASFTQTRIFPQEDAGQAAPAAEAGPAAEAPAAAGLGRLALAEPAAAPEEAAQAGGDAGPAGAPAGAGMGQDKLAEHCLLAGLASLADAELPIMTSDFYSRHMLPAKPPGASLDVKKSSYKQLSKLLKHFEKKGLLAQRVVHKQDHISAVNRSHELYRSDAAAAARAAAPAQGAAGGAPGSGRGGHGGAGGSLRITCCYRFPASLRPILGAGGAAARDELHEEAQVRAALEAYTAASGLRRPGEAAARLDRLLLGGLFNKKEAAAEGEARPLADLHARLLARLQLFHSVARTDEAGVVSEQVTKGPLRSVVVQTEDRQGGRKHVTRLAHVEAFGLVPEQLAGALQRKFQTSSSVAKLPGKQEAGKEISLQGDLLHEVPAFLAAAYGIDAAHITVVPRKKG